jgi:epoxyqueuosine reductase
MAPWAERIVEQLENRGFLSPRFLDTAALSDRDLAGWEEMGHEVAPLRERGIVLVTGVPYRTAGPVDLSTPDSPHGTFAPFAWRNHYRGAATALKETLRPVQEALGRSPKGIRVFSNSRLPEKPLAALAGLGSYGKNSLILTRECGSAFIIAGAILPPLEPLSARGSAGTAVFSGLPPGTLCGSCDLCVRTCPAGAITSPGIIDRSRCFQSLSTIHILLSEEQMAAWGKRIYGCNACQDSCPYNRTPRQGSAVGLDKPGCSLPLADLLSIETPAELRSFFKGTVLDMGWIDHRAIQRNSLIAAGNSNAGGERLRCAVSRFISSPDPILRQTAAWALNRMPGPALPRGGCPPGVPSA